MRQALHTPWSDVIGLLRFDPTQNANGYRANTTPEARMLMCTFEEGVSQNEFYLSMKQGMQATASVEIWTADYQGEKFACFGNRFFRVLRAFQSGFDYTTLILSEVIR